LNQLRHRWRLLWRWFSVWPIVKIYNDNVMYDGQVDNCVYIMFATYTHWQPATTAVEKVVRVEIHRGGLVSNSSSVKGRNWRGKPLNQETSWQRHWLDWTELCGRRKTVRARHRHRRKELVAGLSGLYWAWDDEREIQTDRVCVIFVSVLEWLQCMRTQARWRHSANNTSMSYTLWSIVVDDSHRHLRVVPVPLLITSAILGIELSTNWNRAECLCDLGGFSISWRSFRAKITYISL